jgi:hypothetical protein
MNRIVLGTAALGSAVAPREATQVLAAAYEAGIRRIDTAPFYGAGYSPQLVAGLGREDVQVSTKFGSAREPMLRYALKRLLRAESASALFAGWQPSYRNRDRLDAQWWDSTAQCDAMARAALPLRRLVPEFLFLHAPPLCLPASTLVRLAAQAHALGFQLGLCSPRACDLPQWLQRSAHIACIQLHLDDVMSLPPDQLELVLAGPAWIHGLYSPGGRALLRDASEREAFCRKLATRADSLRFVIGVKSVAGVSRLAAFAQSL